MKEAESPRSAIARRLKELRKRRGWNTETLANACADLGADGLTQSSIENIESGRRRFITVDELIALAYVLRAAPVDLVLPVGRVDWVEVIPGIKAHPHRAYKWFVGTEPPPAGADGTRSVGVAEWFESTIPLRLYDDLEERKEAVRGAESEIRRAEFVGDQDSTQRGRESLAGALRDLAEHLDAMTEAGVLAPGLPSEWVGPMTDLGMLKHPDSVRVYDVDVTPEGADRG